ncbi:hypothetical protein [Burkholderia thailandensis]|uniref:hypothetical protein n=1 Tax=Burkholderia thailandensis TaxID=57975 RepID=UPI00165296D5|nr:hypothetical protein [Burkholderia thailandensis]
MSGLGVDDRRVDVERGAEHLMQQAPYARQIVGADAYRHQYAIVGRGRAHAIRRRSFASGRSRRVEGRQGDRIEMETERLHVRFFARRCSLSHGDFVWNMTGILGIAAKIRCIECFVR